MPTGILSRKMEFSSLSSPLLIIMIGLYTSTDIVKIIIRGGRTK
jgi:hypothetical protein